MKKAILTFGLFSMMLVLTSFTTTNNNKHISTSLDEIGGTNTATPRPTLPVYEIGGTTTPKPTLPGYEIGGTNTATPKPTLP